MSLRMLIDSAHTEETRVAVVDKENRLLEYDFESTTKQTFKGNIYLAKVVRVQPSVSAAFVDFGDGRQGFLPFHEIHPDYFRIPMADREELKAQMLQHPKEEDEEALKEEAPSEESDSLSKETSFSDDEEEDDVVRRPSLHNRYKIQEVVHKNQILLVQVVREERAGKRAALTTYLSLAGRYCVLMPNSPRSGGISRKIANLQERRRLKEIHDSLGIPEGMGLIIRTAGKECTKPELKRDTDYLMRLWNTIRETTLSSIAPALIYEEDDIIKRAIRDLYTKNIEKIVVEGEEGYKIAKAFMKTLLPSHVKRIQFYRDPAVPLFFKERIESQINAMHRPVVPLPSGGSIVIHPTEALVSIDINSGRANRGRYIEETAFQTNIEAAEEIARQICLRDLAGLIVIDFIDMDDSRNVNAVERKFREFLRGDRARIQTGKISSFGLLELSRQRLRPTILETSAHPCTHCQGTGYMRSIESMALEILRGIQEEAVARDTAEVLVQLSTPVSLYMLNHKRKHLSGIEERHKIRVTFESDDHLEISSYRISALKKKSMGETEESEDKENPTHVSPQDAAGEKTQESLTSGKESRNRKNRNQRQRRQRHRHENKPMEGEAPSMLPDAEPLEVKEEDAVEVSEQKPGEEKKRHRRNRRHRHRRPRDSHEAHKTSETGEEPVREARSSEDHQISEEPQKNEESSPVKTGRRRKKQKEAPDLQNEAPAPALEKEESTEGEQTPKKKRSRKTWWKKLIE